MTGELIEFHGKSNTEDKWKIDKNNGRNPSENFVFGNLSSVSDFL